MQSVFDQEMKVIKQKEKDFNDKYMGITKIKQLQSDDEEQPLYTAKRQKTDENPEQVIQVYRNRIEKMNQEYDSDPDREDHVIQRPYVQEQMPTKEDLLRR